MRSTTDISQLSTIVMSEKVICSDRSVLGVLEFDSTYSLLINLFAIRLYSKRRSFSSILFSALQQFGCSFYNTAIKRAYVSAVLFIRKLYRRKLIHISVSRILK